MTVTKSPKCWQGHGTTGTVFLWVAVGKTVQPFWKMVWKFLVKLNILCPLVQQHHTTYLPKVYPQHSCRNCTINSRPESDSNVLPLASGQASTRRNMTQQQKWTNNWSVQQHRGPQTQGTPERTQTQRALNHTIPFRWCSGKDTPQEWKIDDSGQGLGVEEGWPHGGKGNLGCWNVVSWCDVVAAAGLWT